MKNIRLNGIPLIIIVAFLVFILVILIIGVSMMVNDDSGSVEESKVNTEKGILSEHTEEPSDSVIEVGMPADYHLLAKEAVNRIDVNEIQSWVDDLDSADAAVRDMAIINLEKEVGLSFDIISTVDNKKIGVDLKRWKKYAESLRTAIDIKIPKIIEKDTRVNHHRALAAQYLGEETPHPEFLPLIRAIILNEQEELYTRRKALRALSLINHEGLVEFLIQQLDSGPVELSMDVWGRLWRLTEMESELIKRSKPDPGWENVDWTETRRQCEEWWKENKDTFVYVRHRMLME